MYRIEFSSSQLVMGSLLPTPSCDRARIARRKYEKLEKLQLGSRSSDRLVTDGLRHLRQARRAGNGVARIDLRRLHRHVNADAPPHPETHRLHRQKERVNN